MSTFNLKCGSNVDLFNEEKRTAYESNGMASLFRGESKQNPEWSHNKPTNKTYSVN